MGMSIMDLSGIDAGPGLTSGCSAPLSHRSGGASHTDEQIDPGINNGVPVSGDGTGLVAVPLLRWDCCCGPRSYERRGEKKRSIEELKIGRW